jgi:hypothetical protein
MTIRARLIHPAKGIGWEGELTNETAASSWGLAVFLSDPNEHCDQVALNRGDLPGAGWQLHVAPEDRGVVTLQPAWRGLLAWTCIECGGSWAADDRRPEGTGSSKRTGKAGALCSGCF